MNADTPTDLVAVHLYSPLAEKFGALHHFAIRSPREAVHALDANFPGFITEFTKFEHYCIVADGDVREGDDAAILPVSREVHIGPLIEGRAFAGAALVSALFPAIGALGAQIIGTALFLGLAIGASLLLAPKTKAGSEDTEKDENYAFTGPENVTGQGVAVPLVYGRVFCGSVVVSAGLELSTELAPSSSPTSSGFARGLAVSYPDPPADIPPPPGGWPPIIDGPEGPQPEGWVTATLLTVVENDGSRKFVLIWSPDPQPDPAITYAWNEKQGYYALVRVQPTADAWVTPT